MRFRNDEDRPREREVRPELDGADELDEIRRRAANLQDAADDIIERALSRTADAEGFLLANRQQSGQ
jgi:hypothetical protein